MDLNRLRILAGLEPIVEQASVAINEAETIKKGAFHKWLGKAEDEKITQVDVDRGLASDDEHVRKMAQFAKNMEETVEVTPANEELVEAEEVHNSDFPKVTFMPKPPANALVLSTLEFNDDTMEYNKAKMGVDVEQATKVKTPADVMKHVNKRLKELKAAIDQYDEKGFNDQSVKGLAVECLEKIKAHLVAGTDEEFKMAQVYYGTLMSPIFDMFPTQLINFLHSKRDSTVVSDKI